MRPDVLTYPVKTYFVSPTRLECSYIRNVLNSERFSGLR